MKALLALLLAFAACLPALGQERPGRERQAQKQGMQPRERAREEHREARRERPDREEHREARRERPDREERRHFSREEHQQLRQDLIEANREMKRRR